MKSLTEFINESKFGFIVKSHSNNIPNFIDLGLPSGTLWAECNLGAKFPEQSGDFYAWGELETKLDFNYDNYKYIKDPAFRTFSKYNADDGKIVLDKEDDVVYSKLGKNYKIPSTKDFEELVNNTKLVHESINGIAGCTLISKINNKSIFFPLSGYKIQNRLKHDGSKCFYLTDELDKYGNEVDYVRAHAIDFSENDNIEIDWNIPRKNGCPIRPICN